MRCNFVDRQVVDNNYFNIFTQVQNYMDISLFLVIRYYYSISMIASILKAHIIFSSLYYHYSE